MNDMGDKYKNWANDELSNNKKSQQKYYVKFKDVNKWIISALQQTYNSFLCIQFSVYITTSFNFQDDNGFRFGAWRNWRVRKISANKLFTNLLAGAL